MPKTPTAVTPPAPTAAAAAVQEMEKAVTMKLKDLEALLVRLVELHVREVELREEMMRTVKAEKKPEPKPEPEKKPEPAPAPKPEPKKDPEPAVPSIEEVRSAAIAYAAQHGKDAMRAVLRKFTEGKAVDILPVQRRAFLDALKAG